MQVVGDDLHLTAIVGAKQMVEEALEHGLDVAWVENADKPKHSHSVGKPHACACPPDQQFII